MTLDDPVQLKELREAAESRPWDVGEPSPGVIGPGEVADDDGDDDEE